MEFVLYRILDISSLLFQLYVVSRLMRLFLGPPTKKTGMVLLVYLFREVVCRLQYVYLPYALVNMLVSAGTLFVITLCYEGKRINKLTTVVLICFCSFVAEVVVAGVLTIQGGKIIINEHNGNAFSFMGMSIILWIIYEIVRTFKNITTRVVIPKAFNIAIDGIINYKFSEAAAKNIPIYSSIVMPSGIKNGVEDIVAILGNLLDNAIEASESSPDNQYIHLDIQYRPGRMFIEVKNGYNGMINQENGELKTGKKDKQSHGIGLKSVETAVSHYDGEVKVEFDTKEFRVNVMLYTE